MYSQGEEGWKICVIWLQPFNLLSKVDIDVISRTEHFRSIEGAQCPFLVTTVVLWWVIRKEIHEKKEKDGAQDWMSPKVAMTGDECVAVCSDLRYGRELQTIATDFPKVQSDKQKKSQKLYFCSTGVWDEPLPVGGPAWPCHRHPDGDFLTQAFSDLITLHLMTSQYKLLFQVKQKIEFRMNMYELKESRQMKPKTFANMVCCLKLPLIL